MIVVAWARKCERQALELNILREIFQLKFGNPAGLWVLMNMLCLPLILLPLVLALLFEFIHSAIASVAKASYQCEELLYIFFFLLLFWLTITIYLHAIDLLSLLASHLCKRLEFW